ncbi:MAG TPA: hypothetical protein VK783_02195 [Bacteroidia bacterium]|nr:hypothetical protein [Bacteroidia bacterium]
MGDVEFCETADSGVLLVFEAGLVVWANVSLAPAMKKNNKAITIKVNLLYDIFLLNVSCGQARPFKIKTKPVDFVELISYNDRKVISNKEKPQHQYNKEPHIQWGSLY